MNANAKLDGDLAAAMKSTATDTHGRPVETCDMVGESPSMRGVFSALPKLAASAQPVIVRGECGTGKTVIARTIHALSRRKHAPFLVVNCAASPASHVQAELFGHEEGTPASPAPHARGRFELAHGGTLLLSEIAELPRDTQACLLRYLETGTIHRSGGGEHIPVDVRLIMATYARLEEAVKNGTLREDLYHRLNVLSLEAPPLRARGTDIQLLADHFYQQFTDDEARDRLEGFSFDARVALGQWHWPGNVRELANRVQRAVIMCDKGLISRKDLGFERRKHERKAMTLDEVRNDAEKRAVLNALDGSVGNVTVAAGRLGVCRMTLYRLMQKHDIDYAPEHPSPHAPAPT